MAFLEAVNIKKIFSYAYYTTTPVSSLKILVATERN